jgi:hypothetical protein
MMPKHFHVIGNGNGEISPIASKAFTKVYFNFEPSKEERTSINSIFIRSKRQKKELRGRFEVFYKPNLEFASELEQKLNKTAVYLELQLHAWPSSGLTLIQSIFDTAEYLHIDKIGFDPSLITSSLKNKGYPAPSTFHNWIAERRYALAMTKKRSAEKFSWNTLLTNKNFKGFLDIANPYELFEFGFATKNLTSIKTALSTTFESWEKHLIHEKIFSDLEKKLYLPRGERVSSNWWLFDEQGSVFANSLSNLLRHHLNQQYLTST